MVDIEGYNDAFRVNIEDRDEIKLAITLLFN